MRVAFLAMPFAVALCLLSGEAQASIMFKFTESGGNVLMQSSGTLDTANLVATSPSGWGNGGIETNGAPESDIMGDTRMGDFDTAFRFNAGTDLSAWVGDMFTGDTFNWSYTGTTQFATYYREGGQRTPGIAMNTEDMSGSLWTPDIEWSKSGTFATLGLTPGTYAITDALTGESITIQIGDSSAVPEPSTMVAFGLGAAIMAGFGLARRRRRA